MTTLIIVVIDYVLCNYSESGGDSNENAVEVIELNGYRYNRLVGVNRRKQKVPRKEGKSVGRFANILAGFCILIFQIVITSLLYILLGWNIN